MNYELRIDIEAVDPDGNCDRPVTEVLLCESEEARVIDEGMEKLRNLFPNKDCTGINAAGRNANATIYSVFAFKTTAEGDQDYYEELDLAGFTSLKRAKQLMKEVIANYYK